MMREDSGDCLGFTYGGGRIAGMEVIGDRERLLEIEIGAPGRQMN